MQYDSVKVMNKFGLPKFFLFLIFALAASLHTRSFAAPITEDMFGLHIHTVAVGEPWPNVAFGYVRLWDTRTTWRDLEPQKGQWNFATLDRYVDEANKRGVKVLLTLGQTPQWAAVQPDAESPYGPGASSAPRSLDDWQAYVETLARRYKGRVHAWEVWNEINVKHFWTGEPARMAELERSAAAVLKRIDPASVVLSPSIQGGAFRQLDAYFEAGGGRAADVISHHFYASTELPEALPERIRRVREIMARHGLAAKPLWNTEIGWLIQNGDGGYGRHQRPVWRSWYKPDPREAAGFVARSYLLSLNGGIRHVFWYAWDNGAMGLAEARGRRPKPAARGYERLRAWLVGAEFGGCAREGGGVFSDPLWVCSLSRAGQPEWIVWSESERGFDPPRAWQVRHMQGLLDAAAMPVSARMTIGPVPVRLVR